MLTGAAAIGAEFFSPIEGFNYDKMNEVLAKLMGSFDPNEWGVSVAAKIWLSCETLPKSLVDHQLKNRYFGLE